MSQTQAHYQLIEETVTHSGNHLSIQTLCEITGVSRSGYYHWLTKVKARQADKELQDQRDFDLILTAYNHRGYTKGSRGIYMYLLHHDQRMARSKIRRLMTKYNLTCPIRKPNPYRQIAKATLEHSARPNLVKRQFKAHGPRRILLTDITYCVYGRHQMAYLSTIKDAFTNEILAYQASPSLKLDFVLEMIETLMIQHGIQLKAETIIHSDQGVHYRSYKFQELVDNYQLRQSMSRKGNCWDNAPQESFFGHLKDHVDSARCHSFEEVSAEIDRFMDYYNHDRYQWGLAKLSPVQYYRFATTGVYPLAHYLKTPSLPNQVTVVY